MRPERIASTVGLGSSGSAGAIRTPTAQSLRLLPLPLGYGAKTAESEGFELSRLLHLPVFGTGAINQTRPTLRENRARALTSATSEDSAETVSGGSPGHCRRTESVRGTSPACGGQSPHATLSGPGVSAPGGASRIRLCGLAGATGFRFIPRRVLPRPTVARMVSGW